MLSSRSCSQYMPEKVRIYQRQLKQALVNVKELTRIQAEFAAVSEMSTQQRADHFRDRIAEKKKLKISF